MRQPFCDEKTLHRMGLLLENPGFSCRVERKWVAYPARGWHILLDALACGNGTGELMKKMLLGLSGVLVFALLLPGCPA
ncbi:hypothetical protein KJ612_18740, partial [Myxococcota bacterium]|nr:hypothetical protein [Myxococcota bacterium]